MQKEPETEELPNEVPPDVEDMLRHVRYTFPVALLQCRHLKTTCAPATVDVVYLGLCTAPEQPRFLPPEWFVTVNTSTLLDYPQLACRNCATKRPRSR